MKNLCLLSSLLIAGLASSLLDAAEKNIALNKKYTWTKAPNYKLCTDPDDKVQLTDGKLASGTAWVNKATVGWFYQSPAGIDVDLGKQEKLGGAAIRIAGGASGVTFPDCIFMYVSNDKKTWSYAGELEYPATAKKAKGYQIRKYTISGLKTAGRYVRLEIHTKGAYIFSDEVEIFSTSAEPVAAFPENSNIKNTVKFSQELIKRKRTPKLSGKNIALNKKYTYSPRPNYWHCTDRGDITQLTDGKYTKGDFWTNTSTVGWSHCSPLDITLDLTKSEPVSGITFNSAAGRAQVLYPELINVYISKDGKSWDYIGDMITDGAKHGNPSNTQYNVFKFTISDLKVRGRYVKFYVVSQTQYVFCDEIEIHRGTDDQKSAPREAGIRDPQSHSLAVYFNNHVMKRCRADLAEMQKLISKLPADVRKKAEAVVPGLKKKINTVKPYRNAYDFKAYIPLNDVHAEIFALNAHALNNAGYNKPFFWNKNRWDYVAITEIPKKAKLSPLSIEMMRKEVRADVINICNPTGKPLEYTVTVSGLPKNANVVLKEVLYTDTREGKTAASALRAAPVNQSLKTIVPAGCNRQIWVSIEKPVSKAGNYKAAITASTPNMPDLKAVINLKIHDLDFPARPSLHVGGWDYSHKWKGKQLAANLAIMKELHVDSPWADYRIAPGGAKFDKDGNLLNGSSLKFAAWDKWQKQWPDARNYCLFYGGWGGISRFKSHTPQFQTAIRDLIKAWGARIKKNGSDPRNLVLLIFDEPRAPEHYKRTIEWAKAVNSANLGIRIYTNPIPKNSREIPPEMIKYIDIFCPNSVGLSVGKVDLSHIRKHQKKDSIFWLYSCDGPAKFLDPAMYHRSQAWRVFSLGGNASFFWQFGCTGGSKHNLWPYTQSGRDYSPYFWDGEKTMHGKHSEAIRESVQDYEYLVMLKKKIASSDKASAARLQKISDDAVKQVVAAITKGSFRWENEKDRSVIDKAAQRVLRALK
ncbi:MAG: discoidin domain-containing protein [Lentisphaeria bacterium]|nr:discoidin domain-containing protein [Lentisphaeria bacterium]